jgi:hypothetical protein
LLSIYITRTSPPIRISPGRKKAVAMLVEEVERRTALSWTTSGPGLAIRIHHAPGAGASAGFRLAVRNGAVEIQGNDERGALFGIGRFFRELRWDHLQASI